MAILQDLENIIDMFSLLIKETKDTNLKEILSKQQKDYIDYKDDIEIDADTNIFQLLDEECHYDDLWRENKKLD